MPSCLVKKTTRTYSIKMKTFNLTLTEHFSSKREREKWEEKRYFNPFFNTNIITWDNFGMIRHFCWWKDWHHSLHQMKPTLLTSQTRHFYQIHQEINRQFIERLFILKPSIRLTREWIKNHLQRNCSSIMEINGLY